ncbi:TonB-dependent receptor plug domain-containing protein [Thiolapillus sp.]
MQNRMWLGRRRNLPLLCATLVFMPLSQAEESVDAYLDTPLEDLLSMAVTSVAKKKQSLSEVAAATFIITREDIRRSSTTSIPEVLRLAPGIQVARIDANKWAISSRGFNNQFANKLLVMIDGRTVYTPSYSGVYWDAQDTLLEDVERIEVIRGPGAAVWGANAVNGVINIITRPASRTEGAYFTVAAGSEEKSMAGFRYGADIGDEAFARFYLKYTDRDASWLPPSGADAGDAWRSWRAGFRADGRFTPQDLWTLQGDSYDSQLNQLVVQWMDPQDPASAPYAPYYMIPGVEDDATSSGWNLLGRWERTVSETSNLQLQLYYDHTERSELIIDQVHDTLDIDFQHQFRPLPTHDLIWGLGYRRISDDFSNTFQGKMLPQSSTRDLFSAFIQDEIELAPQSWRLIIGSRFEHNDYTGSEIQPSLRLLWTPDARTTLWGAVSRAVRTPSRLERGSRMVSMIVPAMPPFLPEPVVLHSLGNEDFDSEKLVAWELGYRVQPRENLSLDLALFYNEYDDLQSFESIRPTLPVSDVMFDNKLAANSQGLELMADWWPQDWWRLQGSYSYLQVDTFLAGSQDPEDNNSLVEDSSPEHQFSLRSLMNLRDDLQLDIWLYRVGALKRTAYSRPHMSIPAYTSLNLRLAWMPARNLELSLAGRNLLDSHHPEFVGENFLTVTEVERSWRVQLRWDY